MSIQLSEAKWLNPPTTFEVKGQTLSLTTDPHTDFWQRSYYGFRNDNAHALLWTYSDNFTFTARASFNYKSLFDQCGLAIYLDSDNWFKASIEYETPDLARLGSVVTNLGYSDWATTDIATTSSMWYRLSRRGPDFLIENSTDGQTFHQMRVFHLHRLGETTLDMGRQDPPAPPAQPVAFGLYACSPLDASFQARFDLLKLEPCLWKAHGAE
jgi:regulation of enolase protein 1 (concanavalin A-like superfamily)